MKYLTKTVWCLCLSALLFGGCDRGQEEMHRWEHPVEVRFSVVETPFVQTRANEIGKDGTGPQYGTIHIRRTSDKDRDTHEWAYGKVKEGSSGSLDYADEAKFYWPDMSTQYFFQAISVPTNGNNTALPGRVTFDPSKKPGGEGRVEFGGYETGLEYFVGASVGPQNLENGVTVRMAMARQVGKIIFQTIKHIDAGGNTNENIKQCKIIFPNLPASATFDLERMYRIYQATMDPEPMGLNGRNFVCLTNSEEKGIEMQWTSAPSDNPENLSQDILYSKTQAIYLPTFQLWDGKDNKPENQSGFFIVSYDNKTYTGNLNVQTLNGYDYIRLWPGDCLKVTVTLQEGQATGGGDGSAIAEWNLAKEQDVPHYPIPGIYTAEDATELLAALQSGKAIPERFCGVDEDGKKVIRLFTNIDWSAVTDTLTIPDGYVLAVQGYNIKMGENGAVEGDIFPLSGWSVKI